MAGSTKACVFCGRTRVKLTREHAIPRWVNRALDVAARGGVTYSSRGPEDTRHIRNDPLLNVVIREVCESCNGGWLHDLEHAFRAIMLGPITGLPLSRPLPRESQLVAAVWAVKTWLLMAHASSPTAGPFALQPHILRYLRENSQPHPTTFVWMGAVNAGPTGLATFIGRQMVGTAPSPGIAADNMLGIIGAFAIGALLFMVYMPAAKPGESPPDEHMVMVKGPTLSYLTQIWPHQVEEVSWPPPSIFTEADLASMWPPGGWVIFPPI